MSYELNFDTQYPVDLPSWIDITHLYDDFEYKSHYKYLQAGIIDPGEIKHSYIAFEAQKGTRVVLKYKVRFTFYTRDYAAISITQSPTAPSVHDTDGRFAFITSESIVGNWIYVAYEVPTNGMHYLHFIVDKQLAQTGDIACIAFDEISIGTPDFPVYRNFALTEVIEPQLDEIANFTLSERVVYSSNDNHKVYVNFEFPEADESPITWSGPDYTKVKGTQLSVHTPFMTTGTDKLIFTYPRDKHDIGIGFGLSVGENSYSRLTIKLNGVVEFTSWGAKLNREFDYKVSGLYPYDTILEIEYDYKYDTYIQINAMYSISRINHLPLLEEIESQRAIFPISETIKASAYFRLRERVILDGYELDIARLLTKEKVRDFELDNLGVYLDEYILPKSGYNKIGLREKIYESPYTGKTGKVLIEIVKAPLN